MKPYTKVWLLVPTKTFLLLQKGSTGSDLIRKHFILVKNKQQLDSLFRLRSEIFKDSSAFTQRRDMNNLITSTAKKKKSYNGTVCICMCVSTSSPWRRTLIVDLGPRPQATYNWGVSSLARSAICHKQGNSEPHKLRLHNHMHMSEKQINK